MVYTPTTWQDNVTVVNAARMTNIENELVYLDPRVPTYGTSLPASPVDGQQAILVDSITNPSYQWLFRYNAGHSADAYKWEFIGGSPARSAVDNQESTASGSYVDLATPGPSFTVPRDGKYLIQASCGLVQGASTAYAAGMSVTSTDISIPTMLNGAGPGWTSTISALGYDTVGLTAGTVLKMQYNVASAVSVSFYNRRLWVWPRKVS